MYRKITFYAKMMLLWRTLLDAFNGRRHLWERASFQVLVKIEHWEGDEILRLDARHKEEFKGRAKQSDDIVEGAVCLQGSLWNLD